MFLLEDSLYRLDKEEKNSLGSSGCYKFLSIVAVAVGTEVGPIYCYSRLKDSGRKRGSSGTPLPVTALIFIRV